MGWISVRLIHKAVVGLHNGQGFPDKALYLAFDIRCSYYGDKEAREACSLHFLFNRPWGSTGFATTNTFAAVNKSPFASLADIKEWEFLSSHDSCWRDAARDKVWAVERDLYNRVITSAGFTEENVPSSKELHWMVSFPLTGAMHKWVQVKISKDPNDTRNYEKLVKVLGSCDEEKSVSPKV